jgi:hypothetical protein
MELRPGTRLKSVVCETQVIVVRAPKASVVVACGGEPMVALDADAVQADGRRPAAGLDSGAALGKRYADEEAGLELLVTKAGSGTLTADGLVLPVKAAKPLPASD